MPTGTSDRRSASRRTRDPGSDAVSAQTRDGPCAAASSPWDDQVFCPFDGGSEELSGVLAGRSNRARRFSSSPIRASAASNRSTSDRMSSSFSAWLSLLRSISCVTHSLNRAARDRVNHHCAAAPATPGYHPAEQLRRLSLTQGNRDSIFTVPGVGYRFATKPRPGSLPADSRIAPPVELVPANPSNLPQLSNALIGRERDVAEIEALLSRYRLVTLVGTAGVGKTSLSLQVAPICWRASRTARGLSSWRRWTGPNWSARRSPPCSDCPCTGNGRPRTR